MTGTPSLLRSGLAVLALGAVAVSVPLTTAHARDLTIGIHSPNRSVDPHWMTSPNQFQVNCQIFEPLLNRNDDASPEPLLATSWERPNDTTWIFHLRKDVKWSDGKPFTAEDAVFTYGRAGNVPKAPTSFKNYVKPIKKAEAVDPYTLKITTHVPAPDLLDKLVYLLIVSKHVGEKATTSDYNSGKAAVGTGPYKLDSWAPNTKTVLVRNPNYWGKKPAWDKVTYIVMENDAARLAAFLAGDIDIIDGVPALEVAKLKKDKPDAHIWPKGTAKIAYAVLDPVGAMQSGKMTALDGSKLTKNPLENHDVRHAMNIAIDRKGIGKAFYDEYAIPTGQVLPPNREGYNPSIAIPKFDAAAAEALLKKAGWHNKFRIKLTTSGTYFENVVGVSEAIAQAWTKIGIPTTVETVPYPVFVQMRRKGEVAAGVASYQNSTGTGGNFFPTLIHTKDAKNGWGILNNFHYSNKKVDGILEKAVATMDDKKRSDLYAEVSKIVAQDEYKLPLFHFTIVHASQKGIGFAPRADIQMRATNAWVMDDKMSSTKPASTSGTAKK